MSDVLKKQVGGSHYKDYNIQPYEFFMANQIPYHKAAIIKRILRYDHPTGGGVTDLDKIIHEVELIKKLQITSPYRVPGIDVAATDKDSTESMMVGFIVTVEGPPGSRKSSFLLDLTRSLPDHWAIEQVDEHSIRVWREETAEPPFYK